MRAIGLNRIQDQGRNQAGKGQQVDGVQPKDSYRQSTKPVGRRGTVEEPGQPQEDQGNQGSGRKAKDEAVEHQAVEGAKVAGLVGVGQGVESEDQEKRAGNELYQAGEDDDGKTHENPLE